MAAGESDDAFFDQFKAEEGYDEFFESGYSRPPKKPAAKGAGDIEDEYAQLSPGNRQPSGGLGLQGNTPTFALDGDDDGTALDMDIVQAEYQQDCRPPELPEPCAEFTSEDLRLREVLADFYLRHRADNLANVNTIIKQYRGRSVADLWVMLAIKYKLPTAAVVDLLSRTLYVTVPFEIVDACEEASADGLLFEPYATLQGVRDSPGNACDLVRDVIRNRTQEGSEELLRLLCFRGIAGDPDLRPQVWKTLLGYLPLSKHSEWSTILAEKRSAYAVHKSEFIRIVGEHQLEVNAASNRVKDAPALLEQIEKDVLRTRQEQDYFRNPATRAALVSILFVYAVLNPDVGYVQGMNELVAVFLFVMSCGTDTAEADAFWCFSHLMAEVKTSFMQSLDDSTEGINSVLGKVDRLLRAYDSDLARHLHKCGCPPSVFTFRWCTVLFAQDATLANVARLWDSFIADPQRFEFVVHACLAAFIQCRDELLQTCEQSALGEVLRGALKHVDIGAFMRLSWTICALERRKQTPPFPIKSASQLVQEFSGWAQTAAVQARGVIEQNIAPVVKEKAGQALGNAAYVAQNRAQAMHAVHAKLQEKEAFEKAQTTVASLWETVRATSSAAMSRTQKLAAEYRSLDNREAAAAKLTSAVDTAATASTAVAARVADALTAIQNTDGPDGTDGAPLTSINVDAM